MDHWSLIVYVNIVASYLWIRYFIFLNWWSLMFDNILLHMFKMRVVTTHWCRVDTCQCYDANTAFSTPRCHHIQIWQQSDTGHLRHCSSSHNTCTHRYDCISNNQAVCWFLVMSIELILFITTNQVSAYSRDHSNIPIVSRLSFRIHSKKFVTIRSPNFYKSIIQENKNDDLFLSFYKRKKQEDLGVILYEKVGRQLWNSNF